MEQRAYEKHSIMHQHHMKAWTIAYNNINKARLKESSTTKNFHEEEILPDEEDVLPAKCFYKEKHHA